MPLAHPGSDLLVLNEDSGGNALLVATASGKTAMAVQGTQVCADDGAGIFVCADKFDETLTGVDTRSRRVLWTLPDDKAGRFAPDFITAYHGAVYASVATSPLILDARTGEDKVPNLAVTPAAVLPGYIIAEEGDGLVAYPATS